MTTLRAMLLSEYMQWWLWAPVMLGVGIAIYFALPTEPSWWWIILGLCTSTWIAWMAYRRDMLFVLLLSVSSSFALLGILVAKERVRTVEAPVLTHPLQFVAVDAIVREVIPQAQGLKLLLEDIWTDALTLAETPHHMRLTVRTKVLRDDQPYSVQAGDHVEMMAMLSPPPRAVLPGSYDFGFNAFFQQIGAVGYAVSPVQFLGNTDAEISQYVAQIRQGLYARIIAILGEGRGHIASALMIGEYRAMPQKILEEMRISGLSHILSVSGMHLTLVATIFFYLSRACMALHVRLTLHYPIKKIAACIAIMGSFFYLLISGMQIAAIRAFLMSTTVLVGILLNKQACPMRAIAVAAFMVLVVTPENLFHPSFQMSFAAVTALLAFYPIWNRKWSAWLGSDAYWGWRIIGYLLGIIVSSFIAGAATTPFAIYHFNQYAGYGMLANMLAIPLTSFYIMPFVVLSFFLFPLGLEKPALLLMGYGIDQLIHIAEWVSHMPQSLVLLPTLSPFAFGLAVMAGLWATLWQSRLRLWGVPMLGVAILCAPFHPTPVLLVDGRSKNFAFKDEAGEWIFSSRRFSSFTRNIWLRANAQEKVQTIKEKKEGKGWSCEGAYCLYEAAPSLDILLLKSPHCPLPKAALTIALDAAILPCDTVLDHSFISYDALTHMQSISVFATGGKLHVESAVPLIPTRPWE